MNMLPNEGRGQAYECSIAVWLNRNFWPSQGSGCRPVMIVSIRATRSPIPCGPLQWHVMRSSTILVRATLM